MSTQAQYDSMREKLRELADTLPDEAMLDSLEYLKDNQEYFKERAPSAPAIPVAPV